MGDDIVKGAKDTGEWIAKNPRKIGNTAGEFIPDAVAAVYTAGGSLAATAGKTALKEGAEAVVEKTVKEIAEAGAEQAGKEALEAGAKKGIKETLEQLAKKEGDDIAAVVTKSLDEKVDEAIAAFDPKTATTAQKGNFGEMVTDQDMIGNGYDALHNRLDDINAATKQGIDGVFKHPGPPPKYVVIDAKYGDAELAKLTDGTRQMSDKWIQDRLDNTISRSEIRNIENYGYDRVVAKVDNAGNITYRKVDSRGYIIRGKKGNWP
ncbi:hypothetical protein [Chryseobacterium vrystaatense]|uniref:Uncharacterized protein n=1 Tax=Chryseobacterium vrystaatense TaxID=307480 RepID=A0A1M5NUW7_9FLAO|nr:hypothetical protein [Chryseobacterium vrystaatense]SHG93300.1 hypothetical protein SAMN02787073_5087 [Chryseobacterium vrystaatense]